MKEFHNQVSKSKNVLKPPCGENQVFNVVWLLTHS